MDASPSVHVAMMQKDEGPILARWLGHYSRLFGHHALTIYDNRSTDPLTLALLFDAEARGARVYRDMPDYRQRSRLILELFRKHDARANRADFYIPVDCDEYLIALTAEGVSFDREDVMRELRRQRNQRRCLQIPGSLYNDPARPGAYVLDRPFIKSFFRSGAIGTLDLGFHFGTSGLDDAIEETSLIYLHYHNKPLEAARATARGKLALAESIDYHGAGANYLRWLTTCDPQDYIDRYKFRLRVVLKPGEPVRLIFPGGKTVRWNAQDYLSRHPDVAGYHLGALHHYLSYGYKSGRFPTPAEPGLSAPAADAGTGARREAGADRDQAEAAGIGAPA